MTVSVCFEKTNPASAHRQLERSVRGKPPTSKSSLGGDFDQWRETFHFRRQQIEPIKFAFEGSKLNTRLIRERVVTSVQAAAWRKLRFLKPIVHSGFRSMEIQECHVCDSCTVPNVCLFFVSPSSGAWLSSKSSVLVVKENFTCLSNSWVLCWSWREQSNANALFFLGRKPEQGSPLHPYHPPKNSMLSRNGRQID